MGTNCAPLLADLFLYSYEAEFIQTLIKSGKRHLAKSFCFTYRYIDDVLSINNPTFGDYINIIYPVELEIKDTTDADHHASYLDLLLKYDNFHRLQVKLYDKRDDFNFDLVNFPFLSSNIPQSPAYGVFVSQLIRYARASSLYEDFIMRSQLLTSKLLKQGFTRNRLIATFKKFYGRHSVLVDRFKVSVTNIIIDLRRFTIDDLVLCHFAARAFADIDVWLLCPLTASTGCLPVVTIVLTGFDFIIACGRCH